jgi:general stress protein YciG
MARKRKRGFAAMDPEKRRKVARKGAQAGHRRGTAHTFTLEEMRRGGRTVSRDRVHMATIGRGGLMSPRRQRAKAKDRNGKE